MVIPDFRIEGLCLASEMMLYPYRPEQLNPASYDILLGNELIYRGKRITLAEGEKFDLHRGEFVLGCTIEKFNMPHDISGQYALKSSLARSGLENLMAGFIDPGYHGNLTLELTSFMVEPFVLTPGMRIGQVIFSRLEAPCRIPYSVTGRYNGDTGPTESKGNL